MIHIKHLENNSILYITDCIEEYNSLISKGLTVIPLYPSDITDADAIYDINNEKWPFTKYAVSSLDDIDDTYLYRIYQRINKEPWIILETEHMLLREMTTDDLPSFYDIYKNKEIVRFIEPLYEKYEDEYEYTKGYIENIYGFYEYGLWTIIDKESGQIIGRAGVSPVADCEFPDLGFVMKAEFQHRGLTFEICDAILDYAKNELGFNTIQARVQPENLKSINLLKRLGFSIPHTPHQGYLTALRTFS